ncbi:hypothetical protein ABIE40_000561 [Rhizobium sp. OAE497]
MAAKKSGKTLNLAAVLDLNEATALRDKLLSMRGSDIVIDASGVERVGGPLRTGADGCGKDLGSGQAVFQVLESV